MRYDCVWPLRDTSKLLRGQVGGIWQDRLFGAQRWAAFFGANRATLVCALAFGSMLTPATVDHWHHRLPGRLVRSNTWLGTEEEGGGGVEGGRRGRRRCTCALLAAGD